MKKENRLQTIDGETLMSRPLTPLNFVVDTLLSQGLHILAGSPKVGKSWLTLWLAVTVAKGESIWGMGVKQGKPQRYQYRIYGNQRVLGVADGGNCCACHVPYFRSVRKRLCVELGNLLDAT